MTLLLKALDKGFTAHDNTRAGICRTNISATLC